MESDKLPSVGVGLTMAGLGLAAFGLTTQLGGWAQHSALLAGVVLVVGGAAITVVSLTPYRDRQYRLPWVRPSPIFPTSVLPSPDEWITELEDFSRHTRKFWDAVRDQFELYGTAGIATGGASLNGRVTAAEWPDELGDDEWGDGTHLPQELSGALLRDFCQRMYQNGAAQEVEERRHELSILVKRWWMRDRTGDTQFRVWLAEYLDHIHLNTTKLLWYIEEAKAVTIPKPDPDYRPYEFLREVLTGSRDVPAHAHESRAATVGAWAAMTKRKTDLVSAGIGKHRLGLMYEPEYSEMRPYLASDTVEAVEKTYGFTDMVTQAPDVHARRLLKRDIEAVARKWGTTPSRPDTEAPDRPEAERGDP